MKKNIAILLARDEIGRNRTTSPEPTYVVDMFPPSLLLEDVLWQAYIITLRCATPRAFNIDISNLVWVCRCVTHCKIVSGNLK